MLLKAKASSVGMKPTCAARGHHKYVYVPPPAAPPPPPPPKNKKKSYNGIEEFLYKRPYIVPNLKFTKPPRGVGWGWSSAPAKPGTSFVPNVPNLKLTRPPRKADVLRFCASLPEPPTPSTSASPRPSSPPLNSVVSYHVRGVDVFKNGHPGNPMIVYGHPYSGKTSLFLKLYTTAGEQCPKNWVQYVEFRQLADLCRSLTKRPKSFFHILALHFKTTEKHIKDLFKTRARPPGPKCSSPPTGELFLDGFDEIPGEERDYFWKLIPQLKNQLKPGENSIRVWISCRSYVKPTMNKVFPELGYYEMLQFTPEQQIDLMYFYWKTEYFPKLTKAKGELLWLFINAVHGQLNELIPGFDEGLGCIPIVIEAICNTLGPQADAYIENGPSATLTGLCITDLMLAIVSSIIEGHWFKTSSSEKYDPDQEGQDYFRVIRLYSEFALKTYPTYEWSPFDSEFSNGSGTPSDKFQITEEMHRVGFILKDDDGTIRLHHKVLGDFFLARYLTDKEYGVPEDVDFDRFLLRNVFFDKEAIGILTYYDAFLGRSTGLGIEMLREFLIKHYRLADGQEKEWEKIRDNGNIWHLAVMQGFHNVAKRILGALWDDDDELKKFLSMRVPLSMLEDCHLQLVNGQSASIRVEVVASSMSVLAMYGYGDLVKDTIELFLEHFSLEEIRSEFRKQGVWTPVHFAAIHTNLWFISLVYGTMFRESFQVPPGIYNAGGYLPTHLLLSNSWYSEMKVKDSNLLDFKELPGAYEEGSSLSASSSDAESPGCSKGILAGGKKTKMMEEDNIGGGEEKKNLRESWRTGLKDYRFVARKQEMKKDYQRTPGLLRTLHSAIEFLVTVGGEDIDGFDKNQEVTMLHLAATEDLWWTIDVLDYWGANLSLQNKDLMTPMHLAGLFGYKASLFTLAMKGSDPSLRDDKNLTPWLTWKQCGEKMYFKNGGEALSKDEEQLLKCLEMADTIECSSSEESESEEEEEEVLMARGYLNADNPAYSNRGNGNDDMIDTEEELDSDAGATCSSSWDGNGDTEFDEEDSPSHQPTIPKEEGDGNDVQGGEEEEGGEEDEDENCPAEKLVLEEQEEE